MIRKINAYEMYVTEGERPSQIPIDSLLTDTKTGKRYRWDGKIWEDLK